MRSRQRAMAILGYLLATIFRERWIPVEDTPKSRRTALEGQATGSGPTFHPSGLGTPAPGSVCDSDGAA